MKVYVFFVLLLCSGSTSAWAQWVELGSSEDSLVSQYGKPDSTNQTFDYFHHAFHGVDGRFVSEMDSDSNIEQNDWMSDSLADTIRDNLYNAIEIAEDSALTDPFNTFGQPGVFRIWLTRDSIELLLKSTNKIEWRSLFREPYYCDIDSEVLQDSFFSVEASAFPLDSEAISVAKVWKKFLELPPWSVDKFMLWTRYDQLLPAYFDVLTCPDYYSQGYHAKLVNVVKDPELHAYILSTVFSPVDSNDSRFMPWKKTSRQIAYFVREDDNWKITSALKFVTRGWKSQKAGRIRYHYPSSHVFNWRRAIEAAQFLDSVSAMFEVKPPRWIDYYYAFGGFDVYRLLGLDVQSGTTGILLDHKSTIIVCDTIENYLHEFVHAAVSSIPRSSLINEGIAEFISNDTLFHNLELVQASEFLQNHKDISIWDVWNSNVPDTASFLVYAAGLIFFDKVAERGGMQAVVAFYKACTSEPEFEKAVSRYLNIESKNIDSYWQAELQKACQKLKSPTR